MIPSLDVLHGRLLTGGDTAPVVLQFTWSADGWDDTVFVVLHGRPLAGGDTVFFVLHGRPLTGGDTVFVVLHGRLMAGVMPSMSCNMVGC